MGRDVEVLKMMEPIEPPYEDVFTASEALLSILPLDGPHWSFSAELKYLFPCCLEVTVYLICGCDH